MAGPTVWDEHHASALAHKEEIDTRFPLVTDIGYGHIPATEEPCLVLYVDLPPTPEYESGLKDLLGVPIMFWPNHQL